MIKSSLYNEILVTPQDKWFPHFEKILREGIQLAFM